MCVSFVRTDKRNIFFVLDIVNYFKLAMGPLANQDAQQSTHLSKKHPSVN